MKFKDLRLLVLGTALAFVPVVATRWIAVRNMLAPKRPVYVVRGPFCSDVAFLPRSSFLVASGTNIRFYSPRGSTSTSFGLATDRAFNIAVAPDGKQLAVSDCNSTVNLWNIAATSKTKVLRAHDSIADLTFSPDSRLLVSGSWRKNFKAGDIFLWDARSGQLLHRYPPQKSFIGGVAFAPDGKQFVTAGGDGTLRLWSVSGQQLRLFRTRDSLLCVAFSPDGRWIASGGWGQKVQIWDVATGSLAHEFDINRASPAEVRDLKFFPDSKRLCVAASKKEAVMIDIADGQVLNRFGGHEDLIMSLDISPDASQLATATWRTLRVWSLDS